jgi:twitching motility two-component system response regulator PilG
MLVDNSLSVCRDVSDLLSGQGYEVVTAVDGFEALSKIKDCRPDLVLLDITLPRLDGYQTCALIRHHRRLSGVPVVMLSGPEGLYDRARGRFVGADYYLTKPFDQDELLATVGRYTSRQENNNG